MEREREKEKEKANKHPAFYLPFYRMHKNDYYNPPIKNNNKNHNRFKKKSIFNLVNNNRRKIIPTESNIESKRKIASVPIIEDKVLEKTEKTMQYKF